MATLLAQSLVLVIGLSESWSLSPAHLLDELDPAAAAADATAAGRYLAWWGYQPSGAPGARANVTVRAAPFSASAPLALPRCGYSDFGLYHLAPLLPASGLAFLGELGKWVPVAVARVARVTDATTGLTVGLIGAPAEKVELAFAKGAVVSTVVCTLSAAGSGTASFDGKSPTCK